jgi:hypothetical protein
MLALALAVGVAASLVEGCGGSSGGVPNGPIEDASGHPIEDASAHDGATGDAGSDTSTTPDGSPQADATMDGADATADTGSADAIPDVGLGDAGDAEVCNMVANTAPAILSTTSDASAPPASTGMTIASGTYFLTSATSYGATAVGCAGISVRGTTLVTAATATTGTLDGVITYTLGPLQQTMTVHALYTTSGTSLSLVATCPANDGGTEVTQYSATPTTITVVQPAPPPVATCGTVVEVFTKQ